MREDECNPTPVVVLLGCAFCFLLPWLSGGPCLLCSHQMEVDARRLRKAMEASPLEQSEELIAKLKTPEGAGQKGCKWVWRQHEWDGTLCYFNKETEEVGAP